MIWERIFSFMKSRLTREIENIISLKITSQTANRNEEKDRHQRSSKYN